MSDEPTFPTGRLSTEIINAVSEATLERLRYVAPYAEKLAKHKIRRVHRYVSRCFAVGSQIIQIDSILSEGYQILCRNTGKQSTKRNFHTLITSRITYYRLDCHSRQ